MSNPAQRPAPGTPLLALLTHASTEVVLGSLSFLVSLAFAMAVSATGLLSSAPLLLSPLMLAVTGLCYLAIERVLSGAQELPVNKAVAVPASLARCGLIALGASVLALVGATGLTWLQTEVIGLEPTEQDSILSIVEGGDRAQLIMLGISAVILAPLTEELLFRYMFFRRLLHSSGALLAFGLSALAFALFHFNPSGVVIYVWLGCVFASAYLLSGRLWVAMLTHGAYNATAFVQLVMELSPDSM